MKCLKVGKRKVNFELTIHLDDCCKTYLLVVVLEHQVVLGMHQVVLGMHQVVLGMHQLKWYE